MTAVCLLALLAEASPSLAKKAGGAAGYTLVGNATLVSPGANNSNTAVQLISDGPAASLTYGAIGFAVAPGLKLAGVNDLATDYELLTGSCWEGSPRFTLGIAKGGGPTEEIYFYIGLQPAPCSSGSYANTGNLASPNSPVDTKHLPGGSFSDTYSAAQAKYGNYTVRYIAIDLDGGGAGDQKANFDNTQVDSTLYTYEP